MSNLWKALRDVSRDVDPTIGFEPPVEASQIAEVPEVPELEIHEPPAVVLDPPPVRHTYVREPSQPAEPESPVLSWPPPATRVRPPKNYVTKDPHAAPIRSLIEREATATPPTTTGVPARPPAARATPRPVPDPTTGPPNGNGNGNGAKPDPALTSTPAAAAASPDRPVRPPIGLNTPARNRPAGGINGASKGSGPTARVVPPATLPSANGDAVPAGPTSRRPGSPRQLGSSGQARQPSSTPPLRPSRSIAHAALDFSSPTAPTSAPDSPASPPAAGPEPSEAAAAPAPPATGAPRRSPARAATPTPAAGPAAPVRPAAAAPEPLPAAPAATKTEAPAEAAPAVAPPAARPYARAVQSPTPAPTPTPTRAPAAAPGLAATPGRWSPPILNEPDVVAQALVNPDWKPGDDDVFPKGGKRPHARLRDRLRW